MNREADHRGGPLAGLRILEVAGLGAAPFCAMVLADLGAEVIRIGRVAEVNEGGTLQAVVGLAHGDPATNVLDRGRRSIAVDLKQEEGRGLVFDLVDSADGLVEGFRPGVMERLGIGPDACLERNPRLVYGRMTGWGQEGPYARTAGHDINYIALAGALHAFGRRGDPPTPPLNLLGDFAGGGMLLAVGLLAALLEARISGRGQVVDAAMVDGSALLMTMMYGLRGAGAWSDERGTNFNDTGAPFYNVYETADGRYLTIGAIEPQFYAELLDRVGIDADARDQWDRAEWPAMQQQLARVFAQRTLGQWCEALEGTDVCFAPVLSLEEAPTHPHNARRGTFTRIGGVVQPAPAPRFSRTPCPQPHPPPAAGRHTREVLAELGLDDRRIADLSARGVIA